MRGFRPLAALASAIGLMGATGAMASSPVSARTDRPTIVLVHGAFMDGSAWSDVRRELEARGRRVIVVDLPGRPANPGPASLEAYRDAVTSAIAGEAAPVILVGHSFGGLTISQAAEATPERIALLVYLAAYLPQSGQSLQMLAGADRDSRTAEAFIIDPVRGEASIEATARSGLFCNDCPPAVAQRVAGLMIPEPLAPLGETTRLGARFAAVPKVYVRSSMDLVISPGLQDRMIAATPVSRVATLRTGHAPFLSSPSELAALLDTLDATVAVP